MFGLYKHHSFAPFKAWNKPTQREETQTECVQILWSCLRGWSTSAKLWCCFTKKKTQEMTWNAGGCLCSTSLGDTHTHTQQRCHICITTWLLFTAMSGWGVFSPAPPKAAQAAAIGCDVFSHAKWIVNEFNTERKKKFISKLNCGSLNGRLGGANAHSKWPENSFIFLCLSSFWCIIGNGVKCYILTMKKPFTFAAYTLGEKPPLTWMGHHIGSQGPWTDLTTASLFFSTSWNNNWVDGMGRLPPHRVPFPRRASGGESRPFRATLNLFAASYWELFADIDLSGTCY